MTSQYYRTGLEQAGVIFVDGLTDKEIQQIEKEFKFRFPPDLKEFLMHALPINKGFINWRDESVERIRELLSWPLESMCFDIEHNVFWLDEWGKKPENLKEAFAIAQRAVEQAPTLIPINGHRYIPDRPFETANPVLSVYQTDIIYYGANLFNYLENEFYSYFGRSGYTLDGEIKRVEFWSKIIEDCQ